jgi:hypothetical protein
MLASTPIEVSIKPGPAHLDPFPFCEKVIIGGNG